MKKYFIKLTIIVTFLFLIMLMNHSGDSLLSFASISNSLNEYLVANLLEKNEKNTNAPLEANISTENSYDNSGTLYRDRINKITMTVYNLSLNKENYTVKVTGPNSDDTGNWQIAKAQTGDTMTVTLTRVTSNPNPGSYTIKVTNNTNQNSSVSSSFQIVGYCNGFDLSEISLIEGSGNANKANTWRVEITGLTGQIYNKVMNNEVDDFKVAIKNNNNKDVTTNFDITKDKQYIYIKNKTSFNDMPKSGDYQVSVTHSNNDYSPIMSNTITRNLFVNKRAIELTQTNAESHRYIRKMVDKKYNIKIKSMVNNVVTYYIEDVENTETTESAILNKTSTLTEFKKEYPNIAITTSYFDKNGKVVFVYDNTLTIKKVLDGNIYFDLTSSGKTTEEVLTEIEFEEQYSEAYSMLKSQYESLENGELLYVAENIKQVEMINLDPKNLNVFALSGGQISKSVTYKGVRKNEFNNFEPYIQKVNDKTTCKNNVCSEKDGFTLECQYTPLDDATGDITCNVDYNNTNLKYVGVYKIVLPFNDAEEQSLSFELFDQETDYYLTSEYDSHILKEDELSMSAIPPSNKRYEYYLGLYLIKGGQKQDKRSDGNINTRIFDHYVDFEYDNEGNIKKDSVGNGILKYYDVDSYQIRLVNYNSQSKNVQYEVSINGSAFVEKNMDYDTFANTYQIDEKFPTCGTDNFLGCYLFDDEGNIITTNDNFQYTDAKGNVKKMVVKSFKPNSSKTDVEVVFDEYNAAGKLSSSNKKMTLEKFKITYPEMYNYVITRFIFDTDGKIMRGTFMGEYKVYEKDGKKINGKEVTDQFKITVDYDDLTNVDKAVTILPLTEVQSGTYYVYSSYETMESIGYINKNAIDENGNEVEATISKNLYPEMWMQNIHMTSITYAKPEYELEVSSTKLGNDRNDEEKMYYNIPSYAQFAIKTNYIYSAQDAEGRDLFDVKVQYYNGSDYIDATDDFSIEKNYVMPVNATESTSTIKLLSIVNQVRTGKYKLVINYENNGGTGYCEQEFEIPSKYYDIDIKSDSFAYAKNVEKNVTLDMITYFVNDVDEIVPSIKKNITNSSSEDLVLDKTNKVFKNKAGQVVFKYSYNSNTISTNEKNYQFILSNVRDVAEIGNYELSFNYQEAENDPITRTIKFDVTKEQYIVELSNRTPKVNDDGMFINYDISTQYIQESELDKIQYTIYYYDISQKKYIDVSSEDSTRRMFKIRDKWDLTTSPNYKGTLIVELVQHMVDMNGTYIIKVKYSSAEMEYELTDYGKNLKSLFDWKIDNVDITSLYTEEGNNTRINGFYNNLKDVTIEATITSPYEKEISWVINKECTNGTCDPTLGANYNDRFTVNNQVLNNKTLTLTYRDDLSENLKLEEGTYALVLYYSQTDYKVYTFKVLDEYIIIEFDKENTLIYSKINESKVSDGLFSNKPGKIYIPVKIIGLDYDNENVKINITNEDGTIDYSNNFIYNRLDFNTSHNLDIDYDSTNPIEPGKYMITIEYANYKRTIKDSLVFAVNKSYFNFYFKNKTYSTNPLIPNDGGTITYEIETENIPNIQISQSHEDEDTNKHVFSRNTRIYDSQNNDVTNSFNIYATNSVTNLDSFILNIQFEKKTITPGTYRVVTHYMIDGYKREKEETFEIANYRKDFEISETKVITSALDGRLHSNLDSIFEMYLQCDYEMDISYMNIKVLNGEDDITNTFVYEKYNDVIKIKYTKNTLTAANYKVILTYQEDGFNITREVQYNMNGEYREIKLSNMLPNNSFIYSDVDNMSYSMDVYTTVPNEEINKLKARIYDEEDNILYSDFTDDNVTNSFNLENKITTEGKYYINIIPFKARIGSYYIELYYYEDETSYSVSNKLEFTIDKNFYKIQLTDDSYVKEVNNYGDSAIYDIDGAKGMYRFNSTYDNNRKDVYSIGVYDGLTLIDRVNVEIEIEEENGVTYFKTDFKTNALIAGNLDFYLCINNLPYVNITHEVKKYINIAEFKLVVDNQVIDSTLEVFNGQFKEVNYIVNPSNYTDKHIIIKSNDENIIKVLDDGRLKVTGIGRTQLIIENHDFTTAIDVVSKERLSSTTYSVNYDSHIIYVLNMNTKSLDKHEFINNLSGLVSNYRILDKDNNDITSMNKSIGTSMSLVNDYESYKIVVIGDLNKDGKINVFDVSMLYSYVRGKINLDEYSLASANIRKQNDIKVADVSKLYSFVRDRISGI